MNKDNSPVGQKGQAIDHLPEKLAMKKADPNAGRIQRGFLWANTCPKKTAISEQLHHRDARSETAAHYRTFIESIS